MALPELYKEQDYQRQTFDRDSEFRRLYGVNASRSDARKFNRYWNSDQRAADEKAFNAAQDAAELAHIKAESKKRAESWDARIAALKEQNAARGEAALKNINASLAARPTSILAPEVPTKPLVSRSTTDWNKMANRFGFADMAAVAKWQADNGFTGDEVDGKFGEKSRAKWHELERAKRLQAKETTQTSPQTPLVQEVSVAATVNKPAVVTGSDSYYSDYAMQKAFDILYNQSIGNKYTWIPAIPTTLNSAIPGNEHGTVNDAVRSDPGYAQAWDDFRAQYNDRRVSEGGYEGLLRDRYIRKNKQGGTMNRINYFQQGGAAPQQDIKAQVTALVQAAMQGD